MRTSAELRPALEGALDRIGLPRLRNLAAGGGVRLSGLTAPAKALVAAALAAEVRGPLLYLTPADANLDSIAADFELFTSLLGARPETARRVLPFPSHEIDPYRGLSPHFEIAAERARVLAALGRPEPVAVIASAVAVLPRLVTPERFARATRRLHPGLTVSIDGPAEIGRLLVEAGYTREDPVEAPGEFSVRGGIVDFFPPGDEHPARVEFVGDEIESVRRYDSATQRALHPIDEIEVSPLRELVLGVGDPAEWRRVAAARFGEGPAVREIAAALEAGSLPAGFAYLAPLLDSHRANLFDHARFALVLADEPELLREHAERAAGETRASYEEAVRKGRLALPPDQIALEWSAVTERLADVPVVSLEELGIEGIEAAGGPAIHIRCQPAVSYHGRLDAWADEVKKAIAGGIRVGVVATSAGTAERVREILHEYGLPDRGALAGGWQPLAAGDGLRIGVAVGTLSTGFCLPDAALYLFSEWNVFEEQSRRAEKKRAARRTFLSEFRDLKAGDYVVHVDNGIGVFVGLKQLDVNGERKEFMELRYAGDDKLYVPVESLDLVQKYTGGARPPVDRLGGTTWERAKTRVKKAMREMAEELLKLYAARKAMTGHAFAADTHWQEEFEDGFEFELTPDQQAAIADVKHDMEEPSPMDRLLCGDVGYGKTEVGMRAAFKAVMDGKQVAVLAPTTVLAFQHLKTLQDRFAAFPVKIEMLSRFRSPREQKQIVADLAAGRLDVIIGTHRLLSKDVQFRDLGLLIVDEEQRFGVTHKERLKQLRKKVDVLTMTATPIPRTLNMSLVGIRDMSIIETPPKDRLAIQTNVVPFDPKVIAQAIRSELDRGGQVYFVHNRVESIYSMGSFLARVVPDARVAIGHGQISERALERVMVDFIARKFDILLATTIIENGLDIPNVNSIIINRADRYGLAQLYQLRGRVGRSDRRAFAYLLVPPQNTLSGVARKRLAAVKEFSNLGSGFRVAALDLEIRGAGNLLGAEQSGHIEAVGFELYMKLLEEAVRELKGEEVEEKPRVALNLKVDLRIDEAYVPDMTQRLALYRRIASTRSAAQIDSVLAEIRDRYGPLPGSVENLAEYARLRLEAERLGVQSIDREGDQIAIKFGLAPTVAPARIITLLETRKDMTLTPAGVVRVRVARRPAERLPWGGRFMPRGETVAAAPVIEEPIFDHVRNVLRELSG